MTHVVAFKGPVEPLFCGKATYAILRVPRDFEDGLASALASALGNAKRGDGEIAEPPVNLALTRAPVVAGAILWAGESLLTKTNMAVRDRVEVRLRPAAPNRGDPAGGIAAALRTGRPSSGWAARTADQQRGLPVPVNRAKTAATRPETIAKPVQPRPHDPIR